MKTPPARRYSWSASRRVEDGREGGRDLRDARVLLGGELVEVLVDRLGRLDLVLDAVEARHQQRREGQVRVARTGPGARNSTRLAFGLEPVIGIRIAAERLRCE